MDSMTKYFKWALIAGIFAVPFIPFIISTDLYFPFITGKNFTFRIVVELLIALYLIVALREPAYRPRFSLVSTSVLALLFVAVMSTILSVDPIKSFWSNFERMEGLLGFLHLVAWFYIVGAVLATEKLWERFLQVSIGASVIMGVYVLFQIFNVLVINQGGLRTDGTFGNAIYLAVYMLFHIFFTLFLAIRHKGPAWVYALYGIAIVLQTTALYFAATRSATLGLLGGLILAALGLVLFEKENKRLRRVALGVIGAVVLVVVVFLSVRTLPVVQNNPVLTRFASISTNDATTKARFMIWGMAAQGVADHPVFGWGFDNFNFVFNKYYNPAMWPQEQWFDRAHNAFIDWAIAGGVLGFLGFIGLFVFAAFALMRAKDLSVSERSVLIGLLAAYAFHSLFVFDNLMSSVYFFVLLALAHRYSRRDIPHTMALTRPVSGGVSMVATPAIIVVVMVGGYFLNAPGLTTASTLIDALTSQKEAVDASGKATVVQKDPRENLESFKVATASSSLGKQEAVEQLLQIASNAVTTEGVDPATRDAFAQLAVERGAQMLLERPGDARLELFYGSFLSMAGASEEGRKHLLLAHQLSPNKQTISFELAINGYLRSRDVVNSLAVSKQAYESAPEYPDAAKYYAMVLMYAGKQAEADALLVKSFGTNAVDDERLISVYNDGKMFDRIITVMKARVTKDPDNPQHRALLAGAYKNAGNTLQATETLRQAVKDFPQYTSQIGEIAKQLGLTL